MRGIYRNVRGRGRLGGLRSSESLSLEAPLQEHEMKQNCWLMLLIALLLATPQLSKAVPPGSATATKEAARTQLLQAYGKLPLSFEANQGQTDNSVSFLVRGRGYT